VSDSSPESPASAAAPIDPAQREAIGDTGVSVSRIGLGCAPLGNLFSAIDDDTALAVVDAAWDSGIRYFDTAPLYGAGLSEERLGRALSGRRRDDYVISTKVGRLLRPGDADPADIFDVARGVRAEFDFSADGARRSLEESLVRLGLDRVDIALVHDPDDHIDAALSGSFKALVAMRDEGIVGAIGAGMNQWQALDRFVREVDLDVVLIAGRCTLIDRGATEVLVPRCAEAGVAVVVGGVFNSGVLAAGGPHGGPGPAIGSRTFEYGPVPHDVQRQVARIERACTMAGVALGAAALQFPFRFPGITSVVVGARSPHELAQDLKWASVPVPDDLWEDIG